jgi:3-phosphoshikimate 1-carboxyvinyltransferase
MEKVHIRFQADTMTARPRLPASKSESNRALMMNAYSGGKIKIHNLSDAADTRILSRLLEEDPMIYDAEDAGTSLRFLASYLALRGENRILTGSDRMKQRPLGILADKLRELGADITFLEKKGFPPVRFGKGLIKNAPAELEIEAWQSSQFISSLLMAGPLLPQGLRLVLKGNKITSQPYISMTLSMMEQAGIPVIREENHIWVPPVPYPAGNFSIEADWSAAAYWFAMLMYAKEGSSLNFQNLKAGSFQGDAAMLPVFESFGLKFSFHASGLTVFRPDKLHLPEYLEMDFTDFPDQGQTLISLCAGLGIPFSFTGLETLAIKETNRLSAMKNEMAAMGISLAIDEQKGLCSMLPGQKIRKPSRILETYQDHRMAMSLAPLAMFFEDGIYLKNPEVTRKSYPGFWDDLRKAGFAAE